MGIRPCVVTTCLTSDDYSNITRTIPAGFPTAPTIGTAELAEAVKRLPAAATRDTSHPRRRHRSRRRPCSDRLTGPTTAALITPAGNGGQDETEVSYRHLLMPIRCSG